MQNINKKPVKFIDNVKGPLIKPCPCAKNHIPCNYAVISHIINCQYNCTYCYLHTFFGKDEIVVYRNKDKIISEVKEYIENSKDALRIGTGEFSDSLAIPEAVSLARDLIKLFASQNRHLLELKTKSDCIEELLDLDSKGQTAIAWSLNPQTIVDSEEHGAVSLEKRLSAAIRCINAGYKTAFHFDPIIYFDGWREEYKKVVDAVFSTIAPQDILWISLGGLRFPTAQRKIIETKFKSSLSFDYLEKGRDNKLRYPEDLRVELFSHLYNLIGASSKDVYVYLCMETESVWNRVGIKNSDNRCFRWYKRRNKNSTG